MGKLTGLVKRLIDIVRGGRSKPRGFELSDDVKQEILSGLGKKPTDDLHFKRSEFDKKPKEEESDN
ncbi:MAG: hypothetical protein JSV60_05715 [Desulfobacterales bacterium]|nr:MAG: hypothetical protein JSV60_05715 [Desulfobacterales bacterium]